jgi:chloramphenicol 3-O-phosphotransferase
MDLIFLHGPAAAGKLTVARELSTLTGIPVFHNHLIVDALLEVFEFGSPEFVRLREQFWLDTFRAAAQAGRSLIFTFAPEATVPDGFPARAASTVIEHGGGVHFVALFLSVDEQERRIGNDDRKRFRKLSSVDTLRRLRSARASAVEQPPADLSIDTEELTAAAAAAKIRDEFDLRIETGPRGYGVV